MIIKNDTFQTIEVDFHQWFMYLCDGSHVNEYSIKD